MIIDLDRFIAVEKAHWQKLEAILNRLDSSPDARMTLKEAEEFHTLYERVSASLVKLATLSSEPQTRRYLESLVARAYSEIHETREKRRRIFPLRWFFNTLPQTFRRHLREFALASAVTLAGCFLGGFLTMIDPGFPPSHHGVRTGSDESRANASIGKKRRKTTGWPATRRSSPRS
jgi:hypothetical protein